MDSGSRRSLSSGRPETGSLGAPRNDRTAYCNWSFTLSRPAFTHSSSKPGEPEAPTPSGQPEWLMPPEPPARGDSRRDRMLLDLLPTGVLIYRLDRMLYANPAFLELAFPPRYHYDVLRALDYFRAAHPDVQPDERISDAVHFIEDRRQVSVVARGRWLLDRAYDEALPFPLGELVGEPSRWNTLRALRVLRWYERRGPS